MGSVVNDGTGSWWTSTVDAAATPPVTCDAILESARLEAERFEKVGNPPQTILAPPAVSDSLARLGPRGVGCFPPVEPPT